MRTPTLSLALVALLAAGCGAPAGMAPAAGVTAIADLALTQRGGLRLLAADGWTKADVHHIKLALYRGTATTAVTTMKVNAAQLDLPVKFENLLASASYRVEARAWSQAEEVAGNQIDNLAVDAASCTTAFDTGTAAVVAIGTLKLRLVDRVFGGAGQNTLAITDGTTVDTTATETVGQN